MAGVKFAAPMKKMLVLVLLVAPVRQLMKKARLLRWKQRIYFSLSEMVRVSVGFNCIILNKYCIHCCSEQTNEERKTLGSPLTEKTCAFIDSKSDETAT